MRVLAARCTFCTLLTLVLVGCGGGGGPPAPTGPKGSVKGKVTYSGKPVTTGTLVVDNEKGFIASSPLGKDGTFELKGPQGASLPAGTYKVGVTPPPNTAPPAAGQMPASPKIEGLPEKFYTPGGSGVTIEVKAGVQSLDIVLE